MNFIWENSLILKNEEITRHMVNKDANYKLLYILGKGFDPRMCKGIQLLKDSIKSIDVILIHYQESKKSTSFAYNFDTDNNYKNLIKLVNEIKEVEIKMWNNISEQKTSIVFTEIIKKIKPELYNEYDEIIIDISSMPRTISFNLIKTILKNKNKKQKLSIIACENSEFDDNITVSDESETASYLNGFDVFSMGMESQSEALVVWLPILGKNAYSSLEKIHLFLNPDEICPVLPFPSKNARRGDEILLEYRELLTNQFSIEKRNIIYVPEFNPIQAYIKFCNTVYYYKDTLSLLGDTKFIFSTQSSKLMDLGALLSVLELKEKDYYVGFSIVESDGYHMNKDKYDNEKDDVYYIGLLDNSLEWEC